MRYSVTVKRPASVIPPGHQSRTSAIDPDPLGRGSYVPTVSRRTGLTLGDAAQAAWQVLCDRGNHPAVALGTVSSKISESGGTIRLPDGTVVVVEREEES